VGQARLSTSRTIGAGAFLRTFHMTLVLRRIALSKRSCG
jgi:hypothetical protein